MPLTQSQLITKYQDAIIATMSSRAQKRFLRWLAEADPKNHPDTVSAVDAAALTAYFQTFPEEIPLINAGKWPFPITYRQRHLFSTGPELPVQETETIRLYGRMVAVPYYSILDVYALAEIGADRRHERLQELAKIEAASPEYQAARAAKIAAAKAQREKRAAVKQAFWDDYQAFIKRIAPLPAKDQMLAKLGYWMQQINHLQKYWQLHTTAKRQALLDYYQLKNEALALILKQESPLLTHSYYRPKAPHRYQIRLCESHWLYYQAIDFNQPPVSTFYLAHKRMIDACPNCQVSVTRNYYASYFTEIKLSNTLRFSFHTPYPIGKTFYGSPSLYSVVVQTPNQSSSFQFGSSMDPLLLKAVGEAEIAAAFMDVLTEAKTAFAPDSA